MSDGDSATLHGTGEKADLIQGGKSRFRWRFWPIFFTVYFGIRLLPEWFPSITGGDLWLFYDYSFLLIASLIIGLEVYGVFDSCLAPILGKGVSTRGQACMRVGAWGLAIGLASVLLLHAVRRGLPAASYVLEFDSSLWLVESECRPYSGVFSARQLMCGSLVDQLEPGMPFEQIIQWLGSPHRYDMAKRTMRYHLGTIREPLASDSEWLYLWLTDDESLQECMIGH